MDSRINQRVSVNGSGVLGTSTVQTGATTATRASSQSTNAIRGYRPDFPSYINVDTPTIGVV